MAHCGHLGIEEREGVTLLARQHKGVREIARTIGRDKPAVSGELARLLPEGQDLDGATDAEANAAYAALNRRPRKRLGWKCPQGVFCSQALHLL